MHRIRGLVFSVIMASTLPFLALDGQAQTQGLDSVGSGGTLLASRSARARAKGGDPRGRKKGTARKEKKAEGTRPKRGLAAGEVGFIGGPAFGARGAIGLKPQLALEATFLTGSFIYQQIEMQTTLISARAKIFLTNNLYAAAGGGFRILKSSTKVVGPRNESDFNDYSANDVGLDVALGGVWNFGALAVGVDGVGYYLPFAAFGTKSSISPLLAADQQDEALADFEASRKKGLPEAMRIYAGIAF
jgi:hypothetical protein